MSKAPPPPAAPPAPTVRKPLPVPPAATVNKALALVVSTLNEKYGAGTVAMLSQKGAYAEVAHVIPTGIDALDEVFGLGGIPLGRLIEIFGAEHSLKSTLSNWLVAIGQKQGIVAQKIDAELSGAAEFDEQLGVQVDRTLISQPDTLEEVFHIILDGIAIFNKLKVPALYVFDSLAASKLKAELEGELDETEAPALRARFLGKAIPKLTKLLKKGFVTVIIVNQLRERIGATGYMKHTYSPGGRTLRHFCHVRVESTPLGQIKKGEVAVGMRAKFKAIKNKLAPPYKECVLELYFNPPRLVPEGAAPKVIRQPVVAWPAGGPAG